ncbi:MAG TPA: hypothetical protein VFE38_02445 [Edaphobacter sp.]|nr:hypothetical protein [Edaphobacter sp.]
MQRSILTMSPFRILLALCILAAFSASMRAQMKVDSFDGPVTANEINSFLTYVTSLTPAVDNTGNNWAQGHDGEETKAMGMVYEISGNTAVLDQMVRFCDAVLSERNDLAPAPVGQHVIWTGRIDPVWPNSPTATVIGTGGEQGDPVGHLGNCARLILQTPAIWQKTVPIGDPHGYGTTYFKRALTFIHGADQAIDGHILKSLLDMSHDDQQYFSALGPYKPGQPVPWNQQMMFNYGFQNLAICHTILHDDPARAAHYHQIVQDSLNWFFTSEVTAYTDKAGNTAYNWAYAPPGKTGEDSNHGSLDVAGFYRAYITGNYNLTAAMMKPFANMLVDVMSRGPKDYSGRVDGKDGTGHSAPTKYIRSGYLLAADFRPDAYEQIMSADLTPGGTTTSTDTFSRFLWVKNQRAKSSQSLSGKATLSSLGYYYLPWTQTYAGVVLLRNSSSETLTGPFEIAFPNMPDGITLAGPSAAGSAEGPYLTIPFATSLPPGQFTLMPVELFNPSKQEVHLEPVAYSGKL